MRFSATTSTILIFAGFFSTADALDAPPSSDIRCLIVGSLLSNSADANQRAAGNMLAMYSMGRLDSFSAQEIEDAMVSEGVAITPTQIKTETVRCGTILQDKGHMMTQIGENIVRRGKAMEKQNASPAAAPSDSKPAMP